MKMKSIEELSSEEKRLLTAASNAMSTAYPPYSGFYVGAAVLTKSGKIFTGSNVENASYGNTICAERAAIFNANAAGERAIIALATIAKGKNFKTKTPSASCGACRQAEYEAAQISNVDMKILLSNSDKSKIMLTKISELLPFAFGPADLGVHLEKFRKRGATNSVHR